MEQKTSKKPTVHTATVLMGVRWGGGNLEFPHSTHGYCYADSSIPYLFKFLPVFFSLINLLRFVCFEFVFKCGNFTSYNGIQHFNSEKNAEYLVPTCRIKNNFDYCIFSMFQYYDTDKNCHIKHHINQSLRYILSKKINLNIYIIPFSVGV